MRQRVAMFLLAALVAGLCAVPAFAQATGSIKGVCKDLEGKPITDAVVEMVSSETGRKYSLKTNKKGEYFSLGIAPGKYKVSLMKDGKELGKQTEDWRGNSDSGQRLTLARLIDSRALAPGEYSVQVRVKDRVSGQSLVQDAKFTLLP